MEPAGHADREASGWLADPAERGPAGPARPSGGERLVDPAERLERARALAWRALDRRDRTENELRAILAEKRVAPEEAAVVVGELLEGGFLDDARYAQSFAEDRRRLDAWGSERIEGRLRALGVAPELIAAALAERGGEAELEAALALLRRRMPEPPATLRERDRALGMLVRKGYDLELAHDAVRRHARAPEPLD